MICLTPLILTSFLLVATLLIIQWKKPVIYGAPNIISSSTSSNLGSENLRQKSSVSAVVQSHTNTECTVSPSDKRLNIEELKLFRLINNHRVANGKKPLYLSPTLNKAAQWKSNDMASNNYFDHDDSIGRDWLERIDGCGYSFGTYGFLTNQGTAGENLAAGSPNAEAIFNVWKRSGIHNWTMLNDKFKVIGIGFATDPLRRGWWWYWSANFGEYDDSWVSSTLHPDGTLVRPINKNTVFLLQDGKRRHMNSPAVFISHGFEWKRIKTANAADLALPAGSKVGFREGTLLKGSDSAVYIVDYVAGIAQKRHMTSRAVFLSLGYDWDEILRVKDSQLPAANGPAVSSAAPHPDGTLVRPINKNTVFLLQDGKRRHMNSPAVFISHGFEWKRIKTANAADLALPSGSTHNFREGALIKGSTSAVYIVDYESGIIRKRHMTSANMFLSLSYDWNEVFSVKDSALPSQNGNDVGFALTHIDGTFIVDVADNHTIYLIEEGSRRRVLSQDVFDSHMFIKWNMRTVATPFDLTLPEGTPLDFREGAIIQGSSDTIYVIDNVGGTTQKRAFASTQVFLDLGFTLEGHIQQVSDSELQRVSNGPDITSATSHPDGTVIRPTVFNSTLYLIQEGNRRLIPSNEVFISYYGPSVSSNWPETATDADLSLPIGAPVDFKEGTLLRGSTSAVYIVDYVNGTLQKRHFTSSTVFNSLGYWWSAVIDVSDSQLPSDNGPPIIFK